MLQKVVVTSKLCNNLLQLATKKLLQDKLYVCSNIYKRSTCCCSYYFTLTDNNETATCVKAGEKHLIFTNQNISMNNIVRSLTTLFVQQHCSAMITVLLQHCSTNNDVTTCSLVLCLAV